MKSIKYKGLKYTRTAALEPHLQKLKGKLDKKQQSSLETIALMADDLNSEVEDHVTAIDNLIDKFKENTRKYFSNLPKELQTEVQKISNLGSSGTTAFARFGYACEEIDSLREELTRI